ncbi:hypothetical protein DB42_EA01220 [Neochlamydia sp. EPS4]|nr:hypothetical protein DB42_EA01220 [Neochlamydia sp. EPS4]
MWKKLPGGGEYLNQENIKSLPLHKKGEPFKKWIETHGKDIERLCLIEIGLTFLPPEIGRLPQLQELDLSNNLLTIIPAKIGLLAQRNTLA